MKSKFFSIVIFVIISFTFTMVSAQRKAGTLMLTKGSYDSLKAEINALPDTDQNKKFFAFMHDFLIKEGDARWINMNGPIAKNLNTKVDSLKNTVNDVQIVIIGDETPIEVKETKIEVKTITAAEAAMIKIKANVAALRAKVK